MRVLDRKLWRELWQMKGQAAAIPLGFGIGRGICTLFVDGARSELYRIPLIIHPSTYAFAATVVLASALLSGWLVRRKLDRLDLIAVLKTRD